MDEDRLIRSAAKYVSDQPSVEGWKTNDLLTALAMETEGQAKGQASFKALGTLSEDKLVRAPGLVDLGRRVLRRWNRALHGLACNPSDEDRDLKDKVFKALTGAEGGTAILAGVIVTAFGLNIVAATLVATLVIRLFADTAGDEVCKWWGEHLEDVPA